MKAPPLVEVTWNDAWSSDTSWHDDDVERTHEPHRTHSVGYLLKRSRKGVTICRDYDDDNTDDEGRRYDGALFIPAGMVVKVRRLR